VGIQDRLRIGRVLALAGLLSLGLTLPGPALAQDEAATPTDAAQMAEEEAVEPLPDTTPPVIDQPADVVVAAADASGAVVAFAIPGASDDVDGSVPVACDPGSGAFFPVGTTTVTCRARDAAGNAGRPVAFVVTVTAPPAPAATEVPTEVATQAPEPTKEPAPTDIPAVTETALPTETAAPTETPTEAPTERPTEVPTATATDVPQPTATASPTRTPPADGVTSDPPTAPTPEALAVDESLLGSFVVVTDGGPLGVLTSIWGNEDFPVSQEFGHTNFSVTHHSWYAYGANYGLDGYEHTGLDVGMPRGTALYSPVDGVIKIAGGTPYYTFYGNGQPGVGELLIETENGNQVILGHLGRIAVEVGDEVEVGQFVGLSGGDNGDHLHLEAREVQPSGGYRIVDPRDSFLVPALEAVIAESTPAATSAS